MTGEGLAYGGPERWAGLAYGDPERQGQPWPMGTLRDGDRAGLWGIRETVVWLIFGAPEG